MADIVQRPEADAGHPWEVWVNQPFHLSGEAEQYAVGAFESCEDALAACRQVVDEFLAARAGQTPHAESLFLLWRESGPEPWVKPPAGSECSFVAGAYARERCEALCASGGGAAPGAG